MANVGKAIGGAASGAATGATIGSVVPGIGTAIGGIVGGIGGLLGGLFGGGPSEQEEAARKAMADIDNLEMPDIEKQKIKLEFLQRVGEFNPQLQSDILQEETELKKITIAPELKDAQMEALQKMSEAGREGLTAEDMAALNTMRNKVASDERRSREAILQNRQQRGLGGAGDELAAQLASGQAAAEKASAEGDRLAAMAQARRLEAVSQSGRLASDIRGQEFGEQEKAASAQDLINKFNTTSRQTTQAANVGARNMAQKYNLDEAQRVADTNTELRNKQNTYNTQLARQQYQDQVDKIRTRANAAKEAADAGSRSREADSAGFGGIMQGLGGLAKTGVDMYKQSQSDDDDEEDAISAFAKLGKA